MKNHSNIYYFTFGTVLVFILGVIIKLKSPIVEWDYISIHQAELWSKGEKFFFHDHPPLYPLLLSFFAGKPYSIFIFRFLNFVAVLLTGFLLYIFSKNYMNEKLSFITVAFYFLTPAVIQGTLLLDFADTSFLPLSFLILIKLIVLINIRFSILKLLALFFIVLLCISFKLTSSMALFIFIFIYWLISKKEIKKCFTPAIFSILFGIIIFFITWNFIERKLFKDILGTYFFYTISYTTILNNILSLLSIENMIKRLIHLIILCVWLSPFLILLWLKGIFNIFKNFKTIKNEIHFLSFISISYFVGYFIVAGLNHGFPRYHMAIWHIIVFLTVFLNKDLILDFFDKENILKLIQISMFISLISTFFLPDPLYLLNAELKKYVITGVGMRRIITHFIILLAFYLVLMISFSSKRLYITPKSYMVTLLTFYFIMNLTQLKTNYITSYEYGTEDKIELLNKLRPILSTQVKIFASPGLIYYLKPKEIPEYRAYKWNTADCIKSVITIDKPEIIILSEGSNTIWQFRLFLFDSDLRTFLNRYYKFEKIKSFWIWIKK